ncbi:MAG: hypothetical protein US50_C0003G0021 [Candidatus Nomurabacteria bacterium GW2011_GWB1_37_5]|uniref:Uncharacterized protein n=1 Tax=Candidatus Nomurabacteria bacterium GW2011_GWB1_37_5 TaxID=1618742 RepID=A0A0G0K5H6_9BACT|nr:MAG: hypothetical protein US50_C0003G0021 [Candidatus Nomurabacteria bacterium GW2011_GWB1_37_5]
MPPKHNPLNDLKWLLIILVGLWFVWFFTGGPEHFESLAGPFLRPPAPLNTGEIYGKDINLGIKTSIFSASTESKSGIKGYISSEKCESNLAVGERCNNIRSMVLRVTTKEGKFVKDTTIKNNGAFKIELTAGDYVILQKSHYGDVAPYQHPVIVSVKKQRYTSIQIVFDNKIR